MVFLNPQTDLVFKKLFGTSANKELLIDFLNNITGREPGNLIMDIEFKDGQNHLKTLAQKFSIVDVRCIDQKKHEYIVEMQNKNYRDFIERAQYYGACGITTQLPAAEEYTCLLPVIFVGITKFKLFNHTDYISSYKTINTRNYSADLNLMEYHFVELSKFKKKASQLDTLSDKWIYMLKNAQKEHEIPKNFTEKTLIKAFQVLNESGWTQQELTIYMQQIDAIMVEKSIIDTARQEGFGKGIEQGIEKGRDEALIATARAMISDGEDIAKIARFTGLTIDAIKKLK